MTPFPAISAALLAAAPPPPASPLGNPMIMMGVMVVMFYFLLIRPQQRQRKELAARVAALQSGDRVVTTSGIHGMIHKVGDATVTIKVAEGTMLEFDKAAVATVQKRDLPAAK